MSCATSVTGIPAAEMAAADFPVDTISVPAACSAAASSGSPVLSYTLISARLSGTFVNSRSSLSGPARTTRS